MKEQNLKLDNEVAKGLSETEFGIGHGAIFKLSENSKLQVSEDGTVTLTYKIANTDDIILGPKKPEEVPFDVYGAFERNEQGQFKEGSIPDVLRLRTTEPPAKQVILKSPGDAILAVTKARKIEHGLSLTEKTLCETEFGIDQGAKFILQDGARPQVSEDGTVTLTYKIANTDDIILGPKKPEEVPFDVYGAFERNEQDQFKEGSIPDVLSLEAGNQVVFKSPSDAIKLVTKAKFRTKIKQS